MRTALATLPKPGYTGRSRRASRGAARALADLTTVGLHPSAPVVRAYWWEETKNFGDLLTPLVLRRLGVLAVRSSLRSATAVGIGSLLQQLPATFAGALWGTGGILDEPLDLPQARAIALRGELTRAHLGDPPVAALGDPGLLLRRFLAPRAKRYDIGVVVHYAHENDAGLAALTARSPGGVTRIGVRRSPLAVARDIASCRVILTTSLHGLILADAFAIPALWVRMPTALYGNDFKFRDHETVARPAADRGVDWAEIDSLREVPVRAVAADARAIETACATLTASVVQLVAAASTHRASPWGLPALAGL